MQRIERTQNVTTTPILYSWKDTATVTAHAGTIISPAGRVYVLRADTDMSTLDTGSLGASKDYALWMGLIGGVQSARLSESFTAPTGMTDAVRLPHFVSTDGSAQIIRFSDALDPAIPIGPLYPWPGLYAPLGCVFAQGQSRSRTAAPWSTSFALYGQVYNLAFTVNATTDVFTVNGHSFVNGDTVIPWSDTTLPSPLVAGTVYYVRDVASATLKLAETLNGTAINITDTGSGRHTLAPSTTFMLPDVRGRMLVGAGTGSGLTAWALGEGRGAEGIAITIAQMPEHDHPVSTNTSTYGSARSLGSNAAAAGSFNTGKTGGGEAHSNVPPGVGMHYILRVL